MKDFEELLESLGKIEHDLDAQQQRTYQPACWDPRAAMAAERKPVQRSRESNLLRLGFCKDQVDLPTPAESEWFTCLDHRLEGPVGEKQLIEWIQVGRVGRRDYVWHASLQGWSLVQDCYLATHLPASPPSADRQQASSSSSTGEQDALSDDTLVSPEIVPEVVEDSYHSQESHLNCRHCGHLLRSDQKFCTHCGTRVS